jgi:choice-of-anchor A domain-containing protein
VFLSGNPANEFALNMINGDVWGKVAVDGSVRARSFGIGTRLTCTAAEASQATLIASGSTVDVTGEIQCGNLVTPASTAVTGLSFRNGKAITGDITAITGVDFDAIESALSSASSSLCSAAGTAATVGSGNGVTFTGSNSASQTFTITAAQLADASSIRFAFADASAVQQVVVNVVGSGTVDFSGFDTNLGGLANGRITWNICSATRVTVSAFNFQGNLLAPLADVVISNAQINGNVAARTLTSTGSGEVHLPQCP